MSTQQQSLRNLSVFVLKFFTHCFPHLHFAFFNIVEILLHELLLCRFNCLFSSTQKILQWGKKLSCLGFRMLQPDHVLWCTDCLAHVLCVGSETAMSPEWGWSTALLYQEWNLAKSFWKLVRGKADTCTPVFKG